MQKAVRQHLSTYAEPECLALSHFPAEKYQFALVIPVYKESALFVERLLKSFKGFSVLVIVVLNQPDSDLDETPQRQLWENLQERFSQSWQAENLHLLKSDDTDSSNGLSFLVVNRFELSQRIPKKQGVGLARKIGTDIASFLVAHDFIRCPWVGSTDADASLPSDYFTTLEQISADSAGAGVFEYSHIKGHSDAVFGATQMYEQWMRYYVAGLQWAGSPYAFHTIGSCLAFHVTSYCQVRGFPKRAGGEDFYLLNKMAKLAPVQKFETCIHLQSRLSDRVPFGTGPAVSKLVAEGLTEQSYLVYNPFLFEALKQLLQSLPDLWVEVDSYGVWESKFDEAIRSGLKALGLPLALAKIRANSKSRVQFELQLKGWFDGFRTLRFLHILEKDYYSPVSLAQAKQTAPFTF